MTVIGHDHREVQILKYRLLVGVGSVFWKNDAFPFCLELGRLIESEQSLLLIQEFLRDAQGILSLSLRQSTFLSPFRRNP